MHTFCKTPGTYYSNIYFFTFQPGRSGINFSFRFCFPVVLKLENTYNLFAICDKSGSNAESTAREHNAVYATTDYKKILEDENIDLVMITTPHNLHASIAIEAAEAKKAIFVEKPMALNPDELNELVNVLEKTGVVYSVGFNRRFSPLSARVKELIKNRVNPMVINYRMNAGYIPLEHWVHSAEGGGRNIGEACHIYDLFNYLTDSEVLSVKAEGINPKTEQINYNDNFIAIVKYKDGSVCSLIYTALGASEVSKEQMDIYFDNKIIYLNDYKELNVYGLREKNTRLDKQDKGQFEELKALGESIKNNDYPIPLWQLIQATEISFNVERQIITGM